ncbi:hypothetical protein B0H11DRAFT_1938328 [Mycena galericulata]|nr:hypothetical protein B0H11DRAFT_1938328 [Mycena galericulata]
MRHRKIEIAAVESSASKREFGQPAGASRGRGGSNRNPPPALARPTEKVSRRKNGVFSVTDADDEHIDAAPRSPHEPTRGLSARAALNASLDFARDAKHTSLAGSIRPYASTLTSGTGTAVARLRQIRCGRGTRPGSRAMSALAGNTPLRPAQCPWSPLAGWGRCGRCGAGGGGAFEKLAQGSWSMPGEVSGQRGTVVFLARSRAGKRLDNVGVTWEPNKALIPGFAAFSHHLAASDQQQVQMKPQKQTTLPWAHPLGG